MYNNNVKIDFTEGLDCVFCDRIKEMRIANGMSQVMLAQKLNVTKQCISNWENNNILPSIDMLVSVAKLFSVSADYLLELSDQKTLNVDDLTVDETAHIQLIINDIRKRKKG